ncbi:MAG: orotidine 5'-phosphate decarboxylase [Euryarchaeota archaeon RBG_16_67_27]|nr:MAG: orotidine 5'-phosphate decarboxylase [Euryarchaeota archaeon RBG_16_67_27]
MRAERGLVLALDTTDLARTRFVAGAVRGEVDAIKVGWPLVLASGIDIVEELARSSYVLCDFKVADIPNTNRLIVEQAVARGASGVIAHGFPGEDSVRACVEAARTADVFVVAEMSHPGGEEFTSRHAEEIARLAVRAGAAGIIAPATRPERIAALRGILGSRLILSPGVGAQGGTATDAIHMGADAVIVGRSIYEAADPAKAAAALASEVARARRGR